MDRYQFVRRKTFESIEKFQKRLNEIANTGWRVVGVTSDHDQITILMERNKNH